MKVNKVLRLKLKKRKKTL